MTVLPPHQHTIEPGEINRRGCRRCEINAEHSAATEPRSVIGFAECGNAVDLAEGFASFWHHETESDRAALAEWARQLHDELRRILYGDE